MQRRLWSDSSIVAPRPEEDLPLRERWLDTLTALEDAGSPDAHTLSNQIVAAIDQFDSDARAHFLL